MTETIAYLREFHFASVVLRLALAMLLGGCIGLERERKRRPAGFRTYMLVCLGAALTVLLSLYEYTLIIGPWSALAAELGMKTDVSRFGAQVFHGIGFIGAGTIIVTKRQNVKGLTTAAGLWTSAIIGLAFGGGFYEGGILATGFIMLAEQVFSRLEYRVLEHVPEINVYMEYEDKTCLDDVLQLYRRCDVKVLNIQITRAAENGEHNACAIFTLRLPRSCTVNRLMTLVGERKGIVSVEEL